MLSRVAPKLHRLGTRSVSGGEVATVVPGTLPSVLGIAGTVLSSVGGFYFLIESKIKESKKETNDRIDKLETKIDSISKDVHAIKETVTILRLGNANAQMH
jgi:hypothetical protein